MFRSSYRISRTRLPNAATSLVHPTLPPSTSHPWWSRKRARIVRVLEDGYRHSGQMARSLQHRLIGSVTRSRNVNFHGSSSAVGKPSLLISSLESLAVLIAFEDVISRRQFSFKKEVQHNSHVDGQPRERVGIEQINVDPLPVQRASHGTCYAHETRRVSKQMYNGHPESRTAKPIVSRMAPSRASVQSIVHTLMLALSLGTFLRTRSSWIVKRSMPTSTPRSRVRCPERRGVAG